MASGWYIQALVDIGNGLIDLDNDTLAVMLVDENYTYDPDHDVVDNGGNDATDPSFNELQGVTNYTDGFGGAREELSGPNASHAAEIVSRRWSPSQRVLIPGSRSPLRPKKPPSPARPCV